MLVLNEFFFVVLVVYFVVGCLLLVECGGMLVLMDCFIDLEGCMYCMVGLILGEGWM